MCSFAEIPFLSVSEPHSCVHLLRYPFCLSLSHTRVFMHSIMQFLTHNFHTVTKTNNLEGPCPVFASYTLAFALQLRKKHGKPSVRVAGECQLNAEFYAPATLLPEEPPRDQFHRLFSGPQSRSGCFWRIQKKFLASVRNRIAIRLLSRP